MRRRTGSSARYLSSENVPPAEGLGRAGEQDDHPPEQTQGWLIYRTLSVSMEVVQTIGVY